MLETVQILLQQLFQMAVYVVIGILLYKKGLIDQKGSGALSTLLLYVILPCVIVKSFFMERTPENVRAVAVSCLLGVLVLLTAMCIAFLVFRRRPIDWFGASFSNAGFMAIPLVTGVMGAQYVFYIAGMVAVLNALQWTVGQAVLGADRRAVSPQAVFRSPLVIAFGLGILIFALQIPLPAPVSSIVTSMAACNTPVAMTVLGIFLGQITVKELVSDQKAYQCSVVRLLMIPLVTVLVLALIPGLDSTMCLALLLAACAPVGSNVAVYAQKLDLDYRYAARIVCLSTILSVASMPILYMLGKLFL